MEILEMIKEFIKPELLIIVPVLYLIGAAIKGGKHDNLIPIILGAISMTLTSLYILATTDVANTPKSIAMFFFTAITQGILLAGASVYVNQLYKQMNKQS